MNSIKTKNFVIHLDKQRHLSYDLNAFCTLETHYGSLTNALEQMGKGSFSAIRTFVWAGMLHEDKAITEQDVGKWITPANLEEVAARIVEAIQASLPEEKKKQPST